MKTLKSQQFPICFWTPGPSCFLCNAGTFYVWGVWISIFLLISLICFVETNPLTSKVKELSLSFSQVFGRIDHLSTAHNLVKLDLASTRVTGEFLHLIACRELQMVPRADEL